ncbi:hypothetical protein CRV24_008693 [Beauveria bassiana]|nr:hypothetical protein CRV24_008693 [Beauveria bassiana]KAH8715353.1 hypothetical protein HC256_004182 [Beauveria bassiana]
MVRITTTIILASLRDASDSSSLTARADAPASSPDDVKQLDTLIDAVETLSDMLKELKQGGSGEPKEGAAGA